ncbi:MAG: class I SAM-dependent methyltransferase [Bacteroidales bacterium]|nr:class I SAM-dependent methyltransferase [Bacteroidales bacterium]
MSVWIVKAVVQKIISFLPRSQKINYLFQKYITKGVVLTDEYFIDRLLHAQKHVDFFRKYSTTKNNFNSFELGTGWYPVIPIYMFLSGADKIYSVDINNLVSEENLKQTIAKYYKFYKHGELNKYLNIIDKDRVNILFDCYHKQEKFSLKQLLNLLNINFIVGDARKLPLQSLSIDLITSNNTFEHIYPEILINILKEFNRVLKQGAIMSHFIDMSDHFAHLDKKISIYNFLKFSDKQWSLIDNSVQPQNRLRITQYIEIYNNLGIKVIEQEDREGDIEKLKEINVDKVFTNISVKELAVSHSLLISIKD